MATLPLEGRTDGNASQHMAGWRASTRTLFVPFALVLAAVPLVGRTVPPLTDLPNHMSHFRIGLDYATSPYFRQWWDFHWALAGNLGVDATVALLAPVLGLEAATRLVITMIPVLTVAGAALIAREIHGRVPPTAALAFVFAYNFPFNLGFVNFSLAAALALLAFGLWLHLGRLGRPILRRVLLAPLGFVVWLAHLSGWGMLGVAIAAAALAEQRALGCRWPRAALTTLVEVLPLSLCLVPMIAWMSNGAAHAVLFDLRLPRKIALIAVALKNDDPMIDLGTVALVWSSFIVTLLRRELGFDRRLATVAVTLFIVGLAMPPELIGSSYADLRLAPYALLLLCLAIKVRQPTAFAHWLGVAAIALLVGHTVYQAATYARLDAVWSRQLAALDHVPDGARVFGLARVSCFTDWHDDRLDHINRMATVRRQAFSNDTWPPAASQTLTTRPEVLAGFRDLDSQKLTSPSCRFADNQTIPSALARLPRNRFDHLWLIGVPPALWPRRDWLVPIWHGTDSALYRIVPPGRPG